MAKHRYSVYTVIRERKNMHRDVYEFDAVIGTYATHMRADEVSAAMAQGILDGGALPGEFKFSVKVSTWYDE